MQKLKSILPSLKEKKRYLQLKVHILDEGNSCNLNLHTNELKTKLNNKLGMLNSAIAGLQIIRIKGNEVLLRVNTSQVNNTKFALLSINKLGVTRITFQTTKIFGTIKKAKLHR